MKRLYCSLLSLFILAGSFLALTKLPEKYGIFGDYYYEARQLLTAMTLDERIAQTLMVDYQGTSSVSELRQYQFGGYIFFAKDFNGKSRATTQAMISELQSVAKIPLLTAVDEEGDIVTRVSQNPLLAPSRFASPSALYRDGGFARIREDTITKSKLLYNLGLNLNLAPVVDVSTNPNDFMYSRSLGQDAELTAEYAKTVIEASQGTGVSYTLKHFPGYGNNVDTHTGKAVDTRTREEIEQNDLLPFRSGIEVGAESVLVSHNIVTSIDPETPASLSVPIHQLLRDELGFTGVILTDEITMGALADYDDAAVRALKAGNDLIITRDAVRDFEKLKSAVATGELDEETINRAALRVLAWKCYKGLI